MFSSYIRFEDIIRISTEGVDENCIQIITINGKFVKQKSLSQMKSLLPHSFIQIEKRDIINLNFLKGLNKNASCVFMEGAKGMDGMDEIHVGEVFKNTLKERLNSGLLV